MIMEYVLKISIYNKLQIFLDHITYVLTLDHTQYDCPLHLCPEIHYAVPEMQILHKIYIAIKRQPHDSCVIHV